MVAAVGLIWANPVSAELPTHRLQPETRINRDSLQRAGWSNVAAFKRELAQRIGRLVRANRTRLRLATVGLVTQVVSVAGTLCFALKTHEQLGLGRSLVVGSILAGLSSVLANRPLARAKLALSDTWSTVIHNAASYGLNEHQAEVLAGDWLAGPARAIKRNLANRINGFWFGETAVDADVESLARGTPARTSSLIELLSREPKDGPGNGD